MFRDRNDAAERLARRLQKYHGNKDAIVLAVPRGGVVIGAVLAQALRLPLDIALAKKIGHPRNSERAIGAVSLRGEVLDQDWLDSKELPPDYFKDEVARIRDDLKREYRAYRGDAKPPALAGKTVILVDDGAATGHTLLAAIGLLRAENPARIVVALPVALREAATLLSIQADEVLSLETPEYFDAIGECYRVFGQVSEEETVNLLSEAARSSVGA